MHSLPQQHEPVWYFTRQWRHGSLPAELSNWLCDPGSLTARLIKACPGHFHVRVLSQVWRPPMHNESKRLRMRQRQMAFIREVYLYCDDQPVVFARTVIPRKTLSGKQKHLLRLGSRPLGAVLFADPHMRRDELELARVDASAKLFHKAAAVLTQVPVTIWGRRSVFYVNRKPLLVSEFFLPGIARCATLKSRAARMFESFPP
ncbi:MAG: chorismate lyase [Gammaproteobacteria bacterium]|nr:chorismate lyase [Gammaproteobacteria bacterium]